MAAGRLVPGTVATGLLLAVALPAAAQNLPPEESVRFSRYVAVRERSIPGYDVPGVPIGSFTLAPSVEISANVTDNVFALENDGRTDGYVRIAPSAQLTSNWSGRSLNLGVNGTLDRFARNLSENVNAVNLSAYGTQDFAGQLRVRVLGRFRTNRESRESQNAFALTTRPIAYRDAVGAVGATKRFGNVQIGAEAGYEGLDFDNGTLRSGGVLEQNYRDGNIFSVRGRADVIQSASIAYFVQGTRSVSSYDQRSVTGVRRGATTSEVLAGARFELPILVRGEVGIGYITSQYRDDRLRSFSGLAIDANMTMFPTVLTTITLNARRSVNDAGTPDSSTYVALTGGVRVDHELLRSLILGASLNVERDRFNGADRRDQRIGLGADADFRLNRFVSLRVNFDRLDLSSDGAARYKSFTRDRALVGIGVKM